jgi:ubiquinone/menaquinone biosynthesis C-methylase UbiE
MSRHDEIRQAYKQLGKEATFYDGMMTYSAPMGKMICRLVWNMDKEKCGAYIDQALAPIPQDFKGKLLEVPVGTGVLSMPVYASLPGADITCLDYSQDMMKAAQKRAPKNVHFVQGDVGRLPFEDNTFDIVLSMNGFHAFLDKEAAYKETFRVLKPGGIFCGCFYIQGQNARTDWFIEKMYVPKGFFTPPFETLESLEKRLASMYKNVKVSAVEGIGCFRGEKGK